MLCDSGDQIDRFRIGFHREFLFADADCTQLQILFKYRLRFGDIGQLIGEKDVFLRILAGESKYGVVTAGSNREAIFRSGGQKNGSGDAQAALVLHEFLIAAARIVGVLVNIDDGVGGGHQWRSRHAGEKDPSGDLT